MKLRWCIFWQFSAAETIYLYTTATRLLRCALTIIIRCVDNTCGVVFAEVASKRRASFFAQLRYSCIDSERKSSAWWQTS